MRLNYQFKAGEFSNAQLIAEQKIARASTGAVRDAADLAKASGRRAIAAAGFSSRWQNALHSKVYPQSGTSLHPSAIVYHKIPYASVFETGATISGQPLLWLPLDSAPLGRGGKKLTPSEAVGIWGRLISINHPGKPPILAAAIRQTDAQTSRRLTTRQIRTGGNKSAGSVRIVPLFVGVPQVADPAKFDVTGAIREVASHIAELYLKNFEE
jgi:hypothetical protein